MLHYADTSALVKLIAPEAESRAMKRWFYREGINVITSDLTRTELTRVIRRVDVTRLATVRNLFAAITVLQMPTERFYEAGLVNPEPLRSLDALHLASARAAGGELSSIVTYDERLSDAARLTGIPVTTPV